MAEAMSQEESPMNVRLDESVLQTYQQASVIRPTNTVRAYKSKQNEFVKWCDDQGAAFSDLTRYTVTGPKLHLFLKECVIGRPKRHKSNRRGQQQSSTEENGTTNAVVGKATVTSYVAAMVDLWRQQNLAKVNSHPSPRDDAVRALLKMAEFTEEDRKRKTFADRGSDTLLDAYTTNEQIQCISTYFWTMRRDYGTNLRNLLTFLLSHYALMRGECARKMELADLHSIRLENEGYSPCRALVMIMKQGKTNQVGRTEVGACIRNTNVQICPHGHLGFYLFWRWHCEQEPFPNFSESKEWFPVKLLKTKQNPSTEMSYKVHFDAVAGALSHIGLRCRTKTHVGRGSGSRMADLGGASEAQIRRLGRWNTQAMEKCYLTSLPRETRRSLAGFEPGRGSFFIARASMEPPENLERQIFPLVEEWKEKLANGTCEQTLAAGGFLELLEYLRTVILQDAVLVMNVFPRHPVWNHAIFKSAEFKGFRSTAIWTLDHIEDPSEQQLERAMPLLKAKLDGVHQDVKFSLESIRRSVLAVESNMSSLSKAISPLTAGTATVQTKLVQQDVSQHVSTYPILSSLGVSASETPNVEPSINASTVYKMSRGINAISDVWKEWDQGLGGGVSVRSLEDQYGAKWCSSEERRFFNRRRRIINLIQAKARSLRSEQEVSLEEAVSSAISTIEAVRVQQRKSLNWVSVHAEELSVELGTTLSRRP